MGTFSPQSQVNSEVRKTIPTWPLVRCLKSNKKPQAAKSLPSQISKGMSSILLNHHKKIWSWFPNFSRTFSCSFLSRDKHYPLETMGHDRACITGLLMHFALWPCASQCPRDLHWWPSNTTHPIMSYCLIGLQTNSVKPHMLSFMTAAAQLLFPQFFGAFGGLCVISNVSLETTDCRGRGLVLPLALFHPCDKWGCALTGKTQTLRCIPGTPVAEK